MKRLLVTVLAAFSLLVAVLPTTAAAAPPTSTPTIPSTTSANPAPPVLVSVPTATVTEYDARGRVLAIATLPASTRGATLGALASGSGSGGSPSASGCRTVTVTNNTYTTLGFLAFQFLTSTYWCWNRAGQRVDPGRNDWWIDRVDGQYYWRGLTNSATFHYDYGTNDGHPYSAWKHYRQGRFENCVVKYGCIGNYYPANTIRAYYDGTWSWDTSG